MIFKYSNEAIKDVNNRKKSADQEIFKEDLIQLTK